MFQVGQNVAYGIHGVCKIIGTELRRVDRKDVEYFILEPVLQPVSCYYIPTQNPKALAKLRALISKDELDQLLSSGAEPEYRWNPDENQRKQQYRDMITNAGCAELIDVLHVLYHHKQEQLSAGKKFHLCDENFLRDAERLVAGELAVVLGMAPGDVPEYLRSNIG